MKKSRRSGRATRRTRAQWLAWIGQYEQSAQTQSAFCAARGLALSSFTRALRRERKGGIVIEHAPSFIPVTLDGAPEVAHTSVWDVELTLGAGVVLRIRGV